MKKIKNRDSQALSWLSGPRTDVSTESPLIGTDLSKGKRWRKSVDTLPKVLSKIWIPYRNKMVNNIMSYQKPIKMNIVQKTALNWMNKVQIFKTLFMCF